MNDHQGGGTSRPVKKRFIAGAVCPRCSAQDRIVNYREGEHNYRECVECGFKDEIRLQSGPRIPDTRVERSPRVEEAPVKILEPPKDPKAGKK